ncbi:MAG: hypothetical protein L0K10_01900 [Brevibacterium aurantiacum]|nr:hypothetical protein [Brevibacterium aurantiacum]
MVEPLSSIEEVAAKTGEEIVGDQEIALANAMIEAASAQVRVFGQAWPEKASAPHIAQVVTTAAAARGFLNPSGFSMERSDSVTLQRADMYAADVELTPYEKSMLRQAASGVSTVSSIPVTLGRERFIPRSQGAGKSPFGYVRRRQEAFAEVDDGFETPIQFWPEEEW